MAILRITNTVHGLVGLITTAASFILSQVPSKHVYTKLAVFLLAISKKHVQLKLQNIGGY